MVARAVTDANSAQFSLFAGNRLENGSCRTGCTATLRPPGFGWLATRRPEGVGCLPKLRQERREAGTVWYAHILKLKNDDIHVGLTNDLRRRFAFHERGQVPATRSFLPLSLQFYIAVVEDEFPTGKDLTS